MKKKTKVNTLQGKKKKKETGVGAGDCDDYTDGDTSRGNYKYHPKRRISWRGEKTKNKSGILYCS